MWCNDLGSHWLASQPSDIIEYHACTGGSSGVTDSISIEYHRKRFCNILKLCHNKKCNSLMMSKLPTSAEANSIETCVCLTRQHGDGTPVPLCAFGSPLAKESSPTTSKMTLVNALPLCVLRLQCQIMEHPSKRSLEIRR